MRRVLCLKNELGLFEDPYHGADEARSQEINRCEPHRALARQAVAESLVLLKNEENLLPLKQGKIAFIGPYTEGEDLRSAWSFSGDGADCVSIRQAAMVDPALADWEIRFAKGCTLLDNGTVCALGSFESETWEEDNRRLLAEAEELARWADTVVLCLGVLSFLFGE